MESFNHFENGVDVMAEKQYKEEYEVPSNLLIDLKPVSGDFAQIVKDVEKKGAALLSSQRYRMDDLPGEMPLKGVYFFSENGHALYVGRTNNLRKRLQYHMRNSHNQATFAFLLAREQTGNIKPTYQTKGSRNDLLSQSAFRSAFDSARKRIRKMDVQFIEELNPVRQAILEIYAAISSKAKYNDFDNH